MPAKLSVNLDNLKYNVNSIKKYIDENKSNNIDKVELLVMVKADAYGAGIVEVSKCLRNQGVKYLGVAYLIEAKKILESKIDANIVVFSNILPSEIEEAVRLGLILTISSSETAKKINEEGIRQNKRVRVHIKVDTGMTRLGVTKKNIESFIKEIKNLENLEIEGIFTHLSSADSDIEYTKKQVETFKDVLYKVKEMGIYPKYVHVCNSSGILLKIAEFCNMVRLGISVYGYYPDDSIKKCFEAENNIRLKGIFKLEAPICSIRDVDSGVYVSYSKTYMTNRESKLATIQIGYADGLNRHLSNKYMVSVNGNDAKIVGMICMDMCMIDITDIKEVKESDMAVVFDYNDGKIDEIAKICETINYEIITTIGKRVERVYIESK